MAMQTAYPTTPVLEASGLPTAEWAAYFLALYRRTGSGTGTSVDDVNKALQQEAAARAAADTALTAAISQENTSRLAADAAEAAARAAADARLQDEINAVSANPTMRTAWWFWR